MPSTEDFIEPSIKKLKSKITSLIFDVVLKLFVKKKYYKNSVKGRDPVKYKVKFKEHYDEKKKKWVAHEGHAVVFMDPVLKKHPDLRRALLRHETDEIKAEGSGESGAHSKARRNEPKLTKNMGGVSGFWREIKRRRNM